MENIIDIKFKAISKDLSQGGFVYGYYVHIKDENRDEHYIVDTDAIRAEIYPDSLCLFTGFKDSNGVEVYTDDIIEFTKIFGRKCIARIDFNNGLMAVADANYEPVYDFFTDEYRFSDIHIIGHCGIGESSLVMDEYENDYYESCVEDPIDVDICIDKISKFWAEFQANGGCTND